MKPIKISIITICYNSQDTIETTIKSVLDQKYDDFEYIIVDGASTDNTLSIVDKYKCSQMRVISELDNGISDAFNKGIKMATGELIGLINADDYLLEGALTAVAQTYQESRADIIYGDTIVLDRDNALVLMKKAQNTDNMTYEMPFIHQSSFITKTSYEKFGGYSNDYTICMDFDLLAKMYHGGCSFAYTGTVLSCFSYGGTSCRYPIKTINQNMQIAAKYGLSLKKQIVYKSRNIPINISKLILANLGLWGPVYRMLRKNKLITLDSSGQYNVNK